MNKSRLFIAVAVLIGLSVAVAMTRRSHQAETKLEKPSASAPKLKKDEIAKLEITRPGQPPIVLAKQNDKWRVAQPVDAEAAQTAVDSALDKLAELEVIGIAASRKENHQRLEVDPAHAVHVLAKGAGDKLLADLHIGAAKSGGTMLRVEGRDEVLTVRGSIRYLFDKEVKDFRNRDITDLDAAELTDVAFESAKGTFKFDKQGETWAQAKDEKPIAKFDPEKVQNLANSAAHLYATDFADPKEDDAASGLSAPLSKVTLTKKDGSTVEIKVGKLHLSGNDHYLRTSTSEVTFRIAKYNAERLMPEAKAFEKSDPPPAAQAGAAPSPMAGGGELPPEIMKQLQQMKAHGGSPH